MLRNLNLSVNEQASIVQYCFLYVETAVPKTTVLKEQIISENLALESEVDGGATSMSESVLLSLGEGTIFDMRLFRCNNEWCLAEH